MAGSSSFSEACIHFTEEESLQSSSSEDLRLPGVTTFCLTHGHLMEDLLFQEQNETLSRVFFISRLHMLSLLVQRMFVER